MMITRSDFLDRSLSSLAASTLGVPTVPPVGQTALDNYIATPTPEYRFDVIATLEGNGYRWRALSITSQQWRTSAEVDKPLWKHWLTFTEPANFKSRVCALIISGGSNTDDPPRKPDPIVAEFAVRMGIAFGELHNVPSQPLVFADEGKPRSEDDLVAYSWDKYLRTSDESWPLRLPMTKAAIRAMDTIATLSAQTSGIPTIDRFIVGGASKRGWTTWLTAAADKRVLAIVPVVIDVLNINAQAEHAYRTYGSWPAALQPYEKMGIMNWLGTPRFDELLTIEDPYAYRDRIRIPKLIVNATGDQFFTPDSSQFYFGGLRGEKYLRYVPNTDHSLKGKSVTAAETTMTFINSIITGTPRPKYAWQWEREGVRVHSKSLPLSVKLWQAENPRGRDFRFETIGAAFHAKELHSLDGLSYVAKVPTPKAGFTAYLVELTFETLQNDLFTVTTGVRISPDTLPFGRQPWAFSSFLAA